jgi:hypothetical protein
MKTLNLNIMNELFFNDSSAISIASNTFINVPIILRYDNLNLIEVVKDLQIGYYTQIPIYHPDGTKLAVAKGARIFNTKEGEKAGVVIDKYPNIWVCRREKQTLFEIRQQSPNLFKTTAELYTNDGYFIKCTDNPHIDLFDKSASSMSVGGAEFSGCHFENLRVGIQINKDGTMSIGCS